MKKYFKLTFILMLMLSFIVGGCSILSKTPTAISPCLNLAPGDSYICDIVANPQDADFLLRLANAGALEADVYKASAAMSTVNVLIKVVEDGRITYADLLSIISDDVSPLIFVVVDEYSAKFAALDVLLTPKDIEFILYHLNRQKALIRIALLRSKGNMINRFREVG